MSEEDLIRIRREQKKMLLRAWVRPAVFNKVREFTYQRHTDLNEILENYFFGETPPPQIIKWTKRMDDFIRMKWDLLTAREIAVALDLDPVEVAKRRTALGYQIRSADFYDRQKIEKYYDGSNIADLARMTSLSQAAVKQHLEVLSTLKEDGVTRQTIGEYVLAKRAKGDVRDKLLLCNTCHQFWPPEDYHKAPSKRGYSARCKHCSQRIQRLKTVNESREWKIEEDDFIQSHMELYSVRKIATELNRFTESVEKRIAYLKARGQEVPVKKSSKKKKKHKKS